LKESLEKKKDIAAYVALLLTPIGHSIPLICTDGFDCMEILLEAGKVDLLIKLMYFICPLFVSCPDELYSHAK